MENAERPEVGQTITFAAHSEPESEDFFQILEPGQRCRVTEVGDDGEGNALLTVQPIGGDGEPVPGAQDDQLFLSEGHLEPEDASEVVNPGVTKPTLVLHPLTETYPEMGAKEFATLKADIEANGLKVPIVTLPDGPVMDGRHRLQACQELGIEPSVDWYSGDNDEDSLRALIASLNEHRRHLSPEQLRNRARRRSAEGASQRQIAREAGVSQARVNQVLKEGGEKNLSLGKNEANSDTSSQDSPKKPATDRQFAALTKAWCKANKTARKRFRVWLQEQADQ